MLDFLPIYKRELKAYLQSPSTWVVLALFFLVNGIIFSVILMNFSQASQAAMRGGMFGQSSDAPNVTDAVIRQVFHLMASLIMFTMPILSMRLVAEEKSRGTFELLVTNPIGDWSILMGKYLALVSVGALMVLVAGAYPLIVAWAGAPMGSLPEWPVVLSCALGLLMMFAAYGAFGVMASALSDNQMTAAFITLIGLIGWQIIGIVGQIIELSQAEKWLWLRDAVYEISAYKHTENFINGVLDLKDILFYALAAYLCLFVASKVLDARRWRI
jgi:ABC-2 type transport system permease protein